MNQQSELEAQEAWLDLQHMNEEDSFEGTPSGCLSE